MKNTYLILIIIFSVGITFSQKKSYNDIYRKAQEYNEKAMPDIAISNILKIANNDNISSSFKDSINVLLSESYRQKRDYEKGLNLLYPIIQTTTNEFIKAKAYNRISALYNEWEKFGSSRIDSVIKYSDKCIKISKKNNYQLLLASSQNELGYIYIQQNKLNKAEKLLKNAYKIYFKNKLYTYSSNVSINLSNLYLKKQEYDKAIQIINHSLTHINQKEDKNISMRLVLQKAKVFEKQQKYDSAFVYMSKGRVLQKQFFIDKLDKQVYEMSAKYNLKLKEAEIKKIEYEKNQEENKNKLLLLLILSMILLFAVLIYVIYLKRRNLLHKQVVAEKEKIILEESIKYKNNELTNAIAHSAALNNILKKIKNLLSEKKYSEIIKTINTNINTENNWNNFLIKFNENHPDFFYLLEKKHSNLSKTEIKLCALLRMKLTSKEIAYILNIEQSSVNKSRQRLRKKLNIDSKINFYDYLNSL